MGRLHRPHCRQVHVEDCKAKMITIATRFVAGEIKEDELYTERDLILKAMKAPDAADCTFVPLWELMSRRTGRPGSAFPLLPSPSSSRLIRTCRGNQIFTCFTCLRVLTVGFQLASRVCALVGCSCVQKHSGYTCLAVASVSLYVPCETFVAM